MTKPGEVGLPPVPTGPEPWDVGGQLPGVRKFSLSFDGVRWALGSIAHTSVWPRGVFEADCQKGYYVSKKEGHKVAGMDCSCGVYAFWTMEELRNQERKGIAGTVLGWGRVAPGKLGWRSQFAMVTSLELPDCEGWQCSEPAEFMRVTPSWIGHFEYGQGVRAERSRQEMRWRSSHPQMLCSSCNSERVRASSYGKCASGCNRMAREAGYCWEHLPFVLSVSEVFSQLSSWYECDLVPAFGVMSEELQQEVYGK